MNYYTSTIVPDSKVHWGQYGTHLGPVGPRWAPCWPHEPCYQECLYIYTAPWCLWPSSSVSSIPLHWWSLPLANTVETSITKDSKTVKNHTRPGHFENCLYWIAWLVQGIDTYNNHLVLLAKLKCLYPSSPLMYFVYSHYGSYLITKDVNTVIQKQATPANSNSSLKAVNIEYQYQGLIHTNIPLMFSDQIPCAFKLYFYEKLILSHSLHVKIIFIFWMVIRSIWTSVFMIGFMIGTKFFINDVFL